MRGVVGVWRYPLKSGAGEAIETVQIGADGVVGDRRWAVADEDGVLVSAKHPRRGGRLLQILAQYDESDGDVTLQVPGAGSVLAGSPDADAAVSDWLGRPVRLRRDVAPGLRLTRRWPDDQDLLPEWESSARAGADAVTALASGGRLDSFVDYGAVHVVTTAQLDALSAATGSTLDPRRFRPNLVVDALGELSAGMQIQIGDVVLRVDVPTPRCVVPGLAQRHLPEAMSVLTAVARQERKQVATLGRAACVGVYATVERPGHIRLGDPVANC